MTTASLARCPLCRAIVNAHWAECLACHGPLEADEQEHSPSALPSSHWVEQWRNLARVSGGLSGEDPRYGPILIALASCERAYKAEDREQFTKEAGNVMRLAAFVSGAVIRWRGPDKKLQGPASVNEVVYDDGRLWVCVQWTGKLYWVSEIVIESIAEGK